MTKNPQELRAAAAALVSAAEMLEHNDAIFKGKWKKGSKSWSGDFIERTIADAAMQVGPYLNADEIAYLRQLVMRDYDHERAAVALLREIFSDSGCRTANHDGSRVVTPDWAQRVSDFLCEKG